MAPAPSAAPRAPAAPHMPAAAGSTTRQTKPCAIPVLPTSSDQANSSFCPHPPWPTQMYEHPALSSQSFYPAAGGAPGCQPLLSRGQQRRPAPASSCSNTSPPRRLHVPVLFCSRFVLCRVALARSPVPSHPSEYSQRLIVFPSPCPVLSDLYPSTLTPCKPLASRLAGG